MFGLEQATFKTTTRRQRYVFTQEYLLYLDSLPTPDELDHEDWEVDI